MPPPAVPLPVVPLPVVPLPVVPLPVVPLPVAPGTPVVPFAVCPGGVPIRPPKPPPPGPPPIPPTPAGPADGSAPECAELIVATEYAAGPVSALTASSAPAKTPARRAAVRCSFSSGRIIRTPAPRTPVSRTSHRSHGCQEGVSLSNAKPQPAVSRMPPASVARGNHSLRRRQSTDIAPPTSAP